MTWKECSRRLRWGQLLDLDEEVEDLTVLGESNGKTLP
jgi:hypothetical protein